MKTTTMKLLVTSVLVALSSLSSNAATITASKPDSLGREYVDIKGDILPDDDKRFNAIVGARPDPTRVIVRLSSPGGVFVAGMNIATSIHDKKLATLVPDGASCGSICAIMWISGSTKAVGGDNSKIWFHNVYNGATGQATGSGNAMLGSYLGKLGFNYSAISWMTEKPANGANPLTWPRAKQFGIDAVPADDLPMPAQKPGVTQTPSKIPPVDAEID
jgi:hypothetical protein